MKIFRSASAQQQILMLIVQLLTNIPFELHFLNELLLSELQKTYFGYHCVRKLNIFFLNWCSISSLVWLNLPGYIYFYEMQGQQILYFTLLHVHQYNISIMWSRDDSVLICANLLKKWHFLFLDFSSANRKSLFAFASPKKCVLDSKKNTK